MVKTGPVAHGSSAAKVSGFIKVGVRVAMEPLVHLSPVSGVVEGSQAAPFDGFRECGGVAPEQVDVLVTKRREAGHFLLMQGVILPAELIENGFRVNRVPEDDDVGDQPQ